MDNTKGRVKNQPTKQQQEQQQQKTKHDIHVCMMAILLMKSILSK